MPTTDRILDWATIAAAGIDTGRVDRRPNRGMPCLEQYTAIGRDGETRLLFGEDSEGGWNTFLEEIDERDGWVSAGQSPDWHQTPAAVLSAVAEWLNRH